MWSVLVTVTFGFALVLADVLIADFELVKYAYRNFPVLAHITNFNESICFVDRGKFCEHPTAYYTVLFWLTFSFGFIVSLCVLAYSKLTHNISAFFAFMTYKTQKGDFDHSIDGVRSVSFAYIISIVVIYIGFILFPSINKSGGLAQFTSELYLLLLSKYWYLVNIFVQGLLVFALVSIVFHWLEYFHVKKEGGI